jgi:hypothetical protein
MRTHTLLPAQDGQRLSLAAVHDSQYELDDKTLVKNGNVLGHWKRSAAAIYWPVL